MSVWFAVLLGLVQGITEFLPVSSSAHLCLLQRLFPEAMGQESALTFDVLLHLATLAAVCAAFRSDLRDILRELGRLLAAPLRRPQERDPESRRMLLLLLLGTLPLGLAVPAEDWVERLSGSTAFIGIALCFTGFLLFLADRLPRGRKDISRASRLDGLLVGLMQALAVLPGLSRSGSTVTAGLSRGFTRDLAVKYSFLLSIPAILGANLLKLTRALRAGVPAEELPAWILGMLAAMVSGYLSIRAVRSLARKGKFSRFSYYCWGLGLLCLLASIFLKG